MADPIIFKKVPIVPIRHSKHLIDTVVKAQDLHPDAREVIEEGKWYVKDGEAILGGPSDTQWDAWMEVASGSDHTE